MPRDTQWEGYFYPITLQMRVCLELLQVARSPEKKSLGGLHPLYWVLQGRVRVGISHAEAEEQQRRSQNYYVGKTGW